MKGLFYVLIIMRVVHIDLATLDKEELFTTKITLKQGEIRGRIVKPKRLSFSAEVEVYLGIPYAAPPIGNLRFMPPGAPLPWNDVLNAFTVKSVCPQMSPDLDIAAQKKMSPERKAFVKRMKTYLKNESEDCLYLNIYVPRAFTKEEAENRTYPVILFIHGESFEWNSGNLYDGTLIASYGRVIFVTINFRLGIFGFLKQGLMAGRANFGLSDQIAALQWIKGNIAEFRGDPAKITVMGHDTGAVCVNFLMLSPVAEGLFHRAILMSGSALSEWALATTPLHYIQLAEQLFCPSENITDCLQRKRKEDIVTAFKRYESLPFENAFTPVVDEVVVLNTPANHMENYSLFSKYDLLAGVNEIESYYLLDEEFLKFGMLTDEANKFLDAYTRAIYKKTPDIVLIKTIEKYLGHLRDNSAIPTRNAVLDALSDMLVTAPVLQTVRYHAATLKNTYLYVFGHHTASENFIKINKSVAGDDLPYALGIPLLGPNNQFQSDYDIREEQLSEKMMKYLANFAKTGNPNFPQHHEVLTFTSEHSEFKQNAVRWQHYNVDTQPYMYFGIPVQNRHYYREEYDKFWNQVLVSSIKSYDDVSFDESIKKPTDSFENDDTNHPPIYEFPLTVPSGMYNQYNNFDKPPASTSEANVTVTILIIVGIVFLLINVTAFGIIYYQRNKLKVRENLFRNRFRCKTISVPDIFEENETNDIYAIAERTMKNPAAKTNVERKSRNDKKSDKNRPKEKSSRIEGDYDAVRVASVNPEAMAGKRMRRWPLSRQCSGSTITMDPHSKVRDWIAHEIVKCSPKFLRKDKRNKCANLELSPLAKNDANRATAAGSADSKRKRDKERVRKVSIAIDATPAARTESVLKQIPIEITKSLDNGRKPLSSNQMRSSASMTCIPKKSSLQRSNAFTSEDSDEYYQKTGTHKSSAHIRLKTPEYLLDAVVPVAHSYSRSDPSPMAKAEPIYSRVDKTKKSLRSFEDAARNDASIVDSAESTSHYEDIIVPLSVRDFSSTPVQTNSREREPISDAATRRNVTKFSPDLSEPDRKNNRLSLPSSSSSCFHVGSRCYEYCSRTGSKTGRIPPPPPPRMTSTLGRTASSSDADKQRSHMTVKLKKSEPAIIEEKPADIIQTESSDVPKADSSVESAESSYRNFTVDKFNVSQIPRPVQVVRGSPPSAKSKRSVTTSTSGIPKLVPSVSSILKKNTNSSSSDLSYTYTPTDKYADEV